MVSMALLRFSTVASKETLTPGNVLSMVFRRDWVHDKWDLRPVHCGVKWVYGIYGIAEADIEVDMRVF